MKRICVFLIMGFLLLPGCNEPDTIVTNIVNEDGSVTRRVEMRNSKPEFPPEKNKVPVDSSWAMEESIEISDSGDTTWILVAEKVFAEAEMINALYMEGGDANSSFSRKVSCTRSFRWFYNVYSFSESIDRYLPYGFPIAEYVKGEGLSFFLLPDNAREEKLNGPDSLRYRSLADTLQTTVDCWLMRGLIDGWMKLTILKLDEAGLDDDFMNQFQGFESIISECAKLEDYEFDDVLLRLFGEEKISIYGEIFKAAEDSIGEDFGTGSSFNSYTVRAVMPGTITETNGFVTDEGVAEWPAKSELFMFEDYTMWAESRVPNRWAWIVTILAVIAIAVIMIPRRKRG